MVMMRVDDEDDDDDDIVVILSLSSSSVSYMILPVLLGIPSFRGGRSSKVAPPQHSSSSSFILRVPIIENQGIKNIDRIDTGSDVYDRCDSNRRI